MKINHLIILVLVVFSIIFFTTCGTSESDSGSSDDDNNPGNTSCVSFKLLNSETHQPSVVKLYFQLKTCNGEPLSGIQPEQFLIKEDDTEVSVYESDQGYAPDPRAFQLATVLLLDMSGSILESGNLPPLQQAAKVFVQTVASGQSISIYTFDGRAELQQLVDFTESVSELQNGIDSLSNYEIVDKSTNLNGAVLQGLDILDSRDNSFSSGVLFAGSLAVFTDGTDQAARVSDHKASSEASSSSFNVYTIGLGGEVDRNHLEDVGKDGSYIADDVNTLESVFADAASDIESMAESYYILAYCSPKRAGDHELELSIREFSGSVTYDFDADGFEGGCSPDDFLGESTPPDGDIEPTNLVWQNPPTDRLMNWEDAKDYCENLYVGDYNDWRMPTISELRSLIMDCPTTVTGGDCGVTDSCRDLSCWNEDDCWNCSDGDGPSDGCYWLGDMEGPCSWYWSSSSVEGSAISARWLVFFADGHVDANAGTTDRYVRCVR